MCELGGADDLDPTSVFGVQSAAFDAEPDSSQAAVKPLQDRSVLTPSFVMATETPAAGSGEFDVISSYGR